jgi:septal ring factor EnvC (AmiA/AmiB activator)
LIVIAAITILTPILHRLSNQTQKSEEIDAEIEGLKRRIEELERQKAEMRESYAE